MARNWWDPREVVKTAWDVTGADSAFDFVGNVAQGDFGDAADQIGRGARTASNVGKYVGKELYKSTPLDNVWNAGKAAKSGDWNNFFKEIALGGLDTAMWLLPGGGAVRSAGGLARLGPLGAAKVFTKGALFPSISGGYKGMAGGKAAKWGFTGAGLVAGPTPLWSTFEAVTGLNGKQTFASSKPSVSQASAADLRMLEERQKADSKLSSAADVRMREEYYKSREKAQQAAGITPIVPNQPTTAPNVVSGTVPGAAPGGLVGLTPDQTYEISMRERELQRQYDELLNQLALAEKQAKANTASTRYGIQREAAGAGQDLATQLAAAGLDFSPASAIGAEQMVQGSRAQQESAAAKSLADFLAQTQQQRTQAAGDLRRNKLFLRGDIGRQQIANTIGDVGSYYGMLRGA